MCVYSCMLVYMGVSWCMCIYGRVCVRAYVCDVIMCYMWACVCVCMSCVCICVRMHIYGCMCMHADVCSCIYAYVYICVSACVCVW